MPDNTLSADINFKKDLDQIIIAKDKEEADLILDKALKKCQSHEDFEKLISQIDIVISGNPNNRNIDILYLGAAEARLRVLKSLAQKNDIESVRLYMQASSKYYDEASMYLDKALSATESKKLALDIYFLKFLIAKDRFQADKSNALINLIAERISEFSNSREMNMQQLNRIVRKFNQETLTDFALKLKLAYAAKAGEEAATEVAQGIKAEAEDLFEEGDFKKANILYKHYIQLADDVSGKDALAKDIVSIADDYFDRGRYAEAMMYYGEYLDNYSGSPLTDYCIYRLGQCLYFTKNYEHAVLQFNLLLNEHPNSRWFDDAFRELSKLYFEKPFDQRAIDDLRSLIEAHPGKKVRDYTELLIGIIYYGMGNYDEAENIFGHILDAYPNTIYYYAANTLLDDISSIRKGNKPSFSYNSDETYKVWDPYTPVNARVIKAGTGFSAENKSSYIVTTQKATTMTIKIEPTDTDRFTEYLYDKEDESRLPKKIKEDVEQDLLSVEWTAPEGSYFSGDKQDINKAWQVPDIPGTYRISVKVQDLGLMRPPDEGVKKDDGLSELTITVNVEK